MADTLMQRLNACKILWIWFLPAALFMGTVLMSYEAWQKNEIILDNLFYEAQEDFNTDLEKAFSSYNKLFYSAQGLFAASNFVSREEWKLFVDQLDLENTYPAVRFLAYAEYVENENKIRYLLEGADDVSRVAKIFPEEERDNYAVVTYVEPYDDIGKKVIGFDILSESVRREATLFSLQKKETVISNRLNFPESFNFVNDSSYVMMIRPIYKKSEIGNSEIKGFIISIISLTEIMEKLRHYNMEMQIFDGFERNENSLLYNSGVTEENLNSKYTVANTIEVLNRDWTIQYIGSSSIGYYINQFIPFYILIVGIILSALSYLALINLYRDKYKAEEKIERQTKLLDENEKRLKAAIEGGALGLWDWHYDSGHVLFSEGWANMLGYKAKELSQDFSTWEKLTHPQDLENTKKKINSYLEGDNPIYQAEFRMKHKDGHWMWILSRGKIIERDENDMPLRIIGTHTDITKLKQTEKQFLEAQKMEAVGKLAGGIAHDFNNLLTIAFGCTKLIRRKILDKDFDLDGINKNLDILDNTGKRGGELVKRLMLFSSNSDLVPQMTNINDLVFGISELIKRSVTDMIEVTYKMEKNIWNTLVDPGQLEQAIINLCVNARDAMEEGGRLIIETKNVKVDDKFTFYKEKFEKGDYVVISVSDTGDGIEEDIQDKIFDPFFSTKEVGKGTGLGLSMVYGLVKDSNGFINIYSEKGNGTTFRLYLPRSDTNATQSSEPDAFELKEDFNGSDTILVVEDEKDIRQLVIDNLELFGYKVLHEENGEKALKLIETCDEKIDLLFSDIAMPGTVSGVDLANKVSDQRSNIKILLTTGYTQETLPHQKLGHDSFSFISKPYHIDDLLKKIQDILHKKYK